MISRLRVALAHLILDLSQVAAFFMAKGAAARLRFIALRLATET
jgi:hypothetical protein